MALVYTIKKPNNSLLKEERKEMEIHSQATPKNMFMSWVTRSYCLPTLSYEGDHIVTKDFLTMPKILKFCSIDRKFLFLDLKFI
jgi:hypothetical protein